MKLKIAAFLLVFSFVVSSCNKKQCPAYGSVDQEATETTTKKAWFYYFLYLPLTRNSWSVNLFYSTKWRKNYKMIAGILLKKLP